MPLFEFECQTCRERVEILQRASDPPYTHCPKCGGEMKKLFSSPAIQFKGSGFYKTDYAKGEGGKADAKSETKSETKTETKAADSSSTTKSE
ncbi:MAG TPA: FmdB family zinc ribbon protein [Thermoanaerobaculia bacterium]|nr:FmdB family zinc ribbon protein [Thermoanaerobaculia bacterium]